MGYVQLALLVIALVVSVAMRPKTAAPKPASLDEFDLPTPDEGTPQCVVFGDVWTSDWQVLAYGNLRTKKVKTSSGK